PLPERRDHAPPAPDRGTVDLPGGRGGPRRVRCRAGGRAVPRFLPPRRPMSAVRRLARGRAVVAAACLLSALSALADDRQGLAPEGKGFAVEMPAPPQHRENLQDPELFAAVDEYGTPLGDGFVMVSVFAFRPEKRALLTEEDVFALGEAM